MEEQPARLARVARNTTKTLFPLLLLLASCRTGGDPTATEPRSPTAEASAARPLNAGFLVIDGVYDTELTAPLDILHHTVFHAEPGMRVFTVAPTHEVVTTFEGLRLVPDHSFADAPAIDVLVVPSAEHNMDSDLENEELLAWVRTTGESARFVMSLCDGAFVLAAAGLLDGREATTFPADIPRFREMFGERVRVLDGLSFVHDGPAITSVGGAKSFDPALHLCELLYGAEAARGIARGLVIDWRREGIAFRETGRE